MSSRYLPNQGFTITDATLALTDFYSGCVVAINRAAGCTVTLPAATGTGHRYTIVTIADQTGDLVIQAASASDVMQGGAQTDMTGAMFPTADATDTITMNGTTTGGLKGAKVELIDVASGVWNVWVRSEASGTEATPFSAAV